MPVTIGAAAAAGQTILGIVQAATENKKKELPLYKTPEEVYKILNATLNQAGGDTITRDFQTNQLDRTFSQIMGGATKLGADPNDLSALFDQKIQGIMKVGQGFHASNMESFSKIVSAYNLVADNKAAEQKSLRDSIADENRQSAQQKQDALQNITGGVNAGISAYSAGKTTDLYKQQQDQFKKIADALKL